MANKSKKFTIGGNSLVELKAELLRKQEEFKKQKGENAAGNFRPKKIEKPSLFSKQNQGVEKRAQKDQQRSLEEINDLEKSRQALERKTKLYEKMTKMTMDIDEASKLPFLVDFEQKAIDKVRDEKHQREVGPPLKKRKSSDGNFGGSDDEDNDEWVDYVDSFGRSRRCLKKDLPHFKEIDQKLSGNSQQKPSSLPKNENEPELLSNDMRREMERQKWEEEMRLLSAKENVHYSDITFNEIRDHGVGFFNFSRDEETRKQQLELLKQLREQTKIERKKYSSLKEKRRKTLEIRLAKVMQRKVVQEAINQSGLDPLTLIANARLQEETSDMKDDDEEEEDESESRLVDDDEKSDEEEVEFLKRDESIRKDAAVREWDVGKEGVLDDEKWMEDRRKERTSEFAPPSMYFDSVPATSNQRHKSKNLYQAEGDFNEMVAENLKKIRNLLT